MVFLSFGNLIFKKIFWKALKWTFKNAIFKNFGSAKILRKCDLKKKLLIAVFEAQKLILSISKIFRMDSWKVSEMALWKDLK